MNKVFGILLVGLLLLNLSACRLHSVGHKEAVEIGVKTATKALADYQRARTSNEYFLGDPAKSEILASGDTWVLIRNTTTSARKLPYTMSGEQRYLLKETFERAIKNYCEGIGKVHIVNEFEQVVISENSVLGKCAEKSMQAWYAYKIGCLNNTDGVKLSLCDPNHPETIYSDPVRYPGVPSKSELARLASSPVSPNGNGKQLNENEQQVIQISSGTGFAITNDGHIVTNNHVIKGCSKVMLANDGKYVPLRVVSNDPTNDLAVLKGDFEPVETFSVNKGNPELMQDIYVAGYPFGKKISTSVKVTRGIISSLTGYGNNFSGIQIDAAIQPGNSGGPIFDEQGNVVGVVVSKLAKQGSITPENTNFGVKANILANLLVSNAVPFSEGKDANISKSGLSKKASDATFYLSCWNTVAEAKKMRTKKVMFSDLD